MKHVDQRNGIYRVRIKIPDAALHAFPDLPKSGDVAVSLGTRDEVEAFRKAPPIIADLKRRIAEAVKPIAPAPIPQPVPTPIRVFRPAEVKDALERWRVATINQAEAEHFSGLAPAISPFGDEAVALSELRYRLSEPSRWSEIADFDARLFEALTSQGLDVPPDHPILAQPAVVAAFGKAWADAERHTENFRNGVFKHWTRQEAPARPSAPAPSPTAGVTLKALLERFIAAKAPKGEDDLRYHWRRLVEGIGDIDVSAVEPTHLEGFLIKLRRFPKTRRPDITKLLFDEILEKHADAGPPLTEATVWKHFVSYGQVFSYSQAMGYATRNPVEAVMPSKPKPSKKVRHYTPEEIAMMFATPMFTGCAKTHSAGGKLYGYREDPGVIILKDGRYWMPILNLFHGNRMEEWGGAKVADIKREGEIDYLDLLERPLKNRTANRLLPIHPKVVELGFLDYVAERRAAGDEYVFPEFPHDASEAEDPEASTRLFSKWWGLWSDANGFPDPTVNFHSFRHTFKRACRGKISEELHDLITGHKGSGGVGRRYGEGGELAMLAEAIKKVEFPSFPLTA